MMTPTYKKILILCGLSFVLCLMSIQSGHNWGGDFSLYLAQTKALLQGSLGELYTSNQFAMQQSDLTLGPSLYPMGYPVMLAPIYYFFGENFVMLKAFNALFFIGSIPLVFNLLRSVANRKDLAWYATIIFAFNHFMIFLSDSVGSDFSAMFLGLWALNLMIKTRDYDTWVNAVLIGLNIFLCYVTRTMGLILIPTMIVFHFCQFLKTKKLKPLNVALPYLIFTGSYIIYGQLFESIDNVYLDLFDTISLQSIGANILSYGEHLMAIFVSLKFVPKFVSVIASFFFFPVLAIGIWQLIRMENLFLMCYSAAMLLLFIIYPYTSLRFIIPVLPFIVYALLNGIDHLNIRFFQKLEITKWVSGALIIATLSQSLGIIGIHQIEGTNDSLSTEMQSIYAYINDEITDDKIFVFHKPRVLRLFTENNGFLLVDFSSNKINQADHLLVPNDQLEYNGFEVQKTWVNYKLMKKIN